MTAKQKLVKKAESLGIKTKGLNTEQLKGAILNAESALLIALEEDVKTAQSVVDDLPETATDEERREAEQVLADAKEALESYASNEDEGEEPATTTTGKPVFELEGKRYVFGKDAPERFNFLGRNKSQDEWINDAAAMELLIKGNSSYIKILKG